MHIFSTLYTFYSTLNTSNELRGLVTLFTNILSQKDCVWVLMGLPSYFNNSKSINIILVLMEESKLTMMQRKKINYNLRNGEPLPFLGGTSRRSKTKIPEVTIRPGSSRRRSRDDIISSGAYERESFRARKICDIM